MNHSVADTVHCIFDIHLESRALPESVAALLTFLTYGLGADI